MPSASIADAELAIWPMASADALPCSERGSVGASATARKGEACSTRLASSVRFSQPSSVLLTPGVPDSM